MANIYDKASLVMIPSGTKDSKIFSQKPVNGDGDFTFSRSTAATRVNADGNIEKETQNLLLQSNSFDTTWVNFLTSETSGQSGYDGSSNAWLLTKTGASGHMRQYVTQSGVHTFSIYLKANASNYARLIIFAGGYGLDASAYFDLVNGSVTSTAFDIDSTIEDAGGGWYRCSVTINQSAIDNVRIYPAELNSTSATSGSIYIQDAQLEQGLVARDYIETTTAAVEGGITDNVPRLDYTDSSCPALLLEPQRTNFLYHSEYFGTFSDAGTAPIREQNYGISPEGVQNSTRLNLVDSNDLIYQSGLGGAGAGVKAFSVFAKNIENGTSIIQLRMDTSSGQANTSFDLSDGTIDSSTADSSQIIDYGNGWYRCISITDATVNNAVFSGGTNLDCEIFGAQLEAGSYATSYIPTYGTSVTRNNDVVNVLTTAGDDGLINDYNTTFSVDLTKVISDNNVIRFVTLFSAGGAANPRVLLYANASSILVQYRVTGQSDITITSSYTQADRNKVSVRLNGTKLALFHNGVKTQEVDIVQGGGIEYLSVAENSSTDSGYLLGQLLSFPTSLTDAECIALTTL